MKFLKWTIALALLCNVQMGFAQNRNACDPCDPCATSNSCSLCDIDFCDVEYSVYADFLYWKVSKGDLNMGQDDGKEEYFNPDYDCGYRLGAVARYNNWDLGVRYTSYWTDDKKSKGSSGDAKFDFDYDVVDIELGYSCCLDCANATIRPFAGAKLAWIDDDFDKSDKDGSDTKIDFRGYGLYLGASGRWDLCSFDVCDRSIPIALVGRASTGILDAEFDQDVEDGGGDRKEECLFVPVHDAYLALDLTFCDLCGIDANLQLGYEVQYWGWREYNDDEDITHLGLGGLVLRFGASFQ